MNRQQTLHPAIFVICCIRSPTGADFHYTAKVRRHDGASPYAGMVQAVNGDL